MTKTDLLPSGRVRSLGLINGKSLYHEQKCKLYFDLHEGYPKYVWNFEFRSLEFVCYLGFAIWDLH